MDTCRNRRTREGGKYQSCCFGFFVFSLGILLCSPAALSADIHTVTRTYAIDSPHPYSSFADLSWRITEYGAQALRVNFSRLEVEDGYDFVYLNSSLETTSLTGNYPEGCWSAWVAGSSFTLRLVSNSYNTDYGFTAVAYEVQIVQAWEPFLMVAIPVCIVIAIAFIAFYRLRGREAPAIPLQGGNQKHR